MSELPIRQVIEGDCLSALKGFPDNSIDLIASDPPYGISFMQKEWDRLPSVEIWRECLRVLKHGAFAFILCTPRLDSLAEEARRLQEAGFIISFSPILWAYGCLTDDTEVYTNEGWKDWHSNRETLINKEILCYDIKNGSYVWEKPSTWHEYRVSEEVYRIRSDETDQLVTRDHRVFTEKGFILAGNASKQESVAYLPVLPEGILGISSMATKGGELWNILFNKLSSESKYKKISFSKWKTYTSCVRRAETKTKRIYDGLKKLGMEGGRYIFQDTWKLCRNKVCSLPRRLQIYGSKGWLCYGASFISGATLGETSLKGGSGSSLRPQSKEQRNNEFSSVCKQQGTQTSRGRSLYKTTMATITREFYRGIVFCPTVSTGCFVARRNGQIFITGNSGFPKSLSISKAVDRKLGFNRERVAKTGSMDETNLYGWSETIVDGTMPSTTPISEEAKRLDGSYAGFQPKPAVEVVIVAMKPLSEKTYVEQALKNGKGITWLEEGRVPYKNGDDKPLAAISGGSAGLGSIIRGHEFEPSNKGRFPANLLVSDDVLNDGTVSKSRETSFRGGFGVAKNTFGINNPEATVDYGRGFNDEGSFSRYFDLDKWFEERIKKLPKNVRKTFPFLIVPKAAVGERQEGLDRVVNLPKKPVGEAVLQYHEGQRGADPPVKNFHPTVKPIKLFNYLITIGSREGDIVLDPFLGSGTTAIACEKLQRRWIGIEINPEYCEIARKRLETWRGQTRLNPNTP